MYETNLAVLTGRNDGTLLIEDSPLTEADLLSQMSAPSELSSTEAEHWVSEELQRMHESWLNMMNFEIELVNFIVDLGDIIWPTAIIVLWLYSIYEGIGILSNKDTHSGPIDGSIKHLQKLQSSISEMIGSAKLTVISWWADFSRKHTQIVDNISQRMQSALNHTKEKFSSHTSRISSSAISVVSRGSHDQRRKLEMYGRESSLGSWIAFSIFMAILLLFLIWLPIAESDDFRWKKVLQVSNVLITLSIFILMSFSLNLHTGYTGMVNFGVIFFVAIGTITVGILTAPGATWLWMGNLTCHINCNSSRSIIWMGLSLSCSQTQNRLLRHRNHFTWRDSEVLLAGEPLMRVGAVGSAIGDLILPIAS